MTASLVDGDGRESLPAEHSQAAAERMLFEARETVASGMENPPWLLMIWVFEDGDLSLLCLGVTTRE